jgi:hypothetical protein
MEELRHRCWGPAFRWGARAIHSGINWHLGYRLANHLKHHRSQRAYQLPQEMACYEHFQRLGLEFLRLPNRESR